MTDKELEKIYSNIEMQMIAEQATSHTGNIPNSLREKINLYNEVIDLREKLKDKERILNVAKDYIDQVLMYEISRITPEGKYRKIYNELGTLVGILMGKEMNDETGKNV